MRRSPASISWFSAMLPDAIWSELGRLPLRHRCERSGWTRHLVALLLLSGLLLLLAGRDALAMVEVWSRTGAFNHCFLILPIAMWLVWKRRDCLRLLTPECSLLGCLVVALGSLLWLAGEAGHVSLFRQAGFVIGQLGLVLATLGRPVVRAIAFPLAFCLFMIPVGSEIEPWLQTATARIALDLLHLSGTPAAAQGVFIATPVGLFRVAEACSGAGFLLAMAAFAALVGALCFRSWPRRIGFAVLALALAVVTNGVRAWGIMAIANRTSMSNPVISDHIVYGWLLFAAVIALLMWIASPWFDQHGDEDDADPRALQGIARNGRSIRSVAPLAGGVLALPMVWLALTDGQQTRTSPPPLAPRIAGWRIPSGAFQPSWQPRFEGATWLGQWKYAGPDGQVADIAVVIFDDQGEGREITGFGQGAVGPDGQGAWRSGGTAPAPPQGSGEWLRSNDGAMRHAVTFYIVDDVVTGSRATAKLFSIRSRLLGRGQGARAIIVSAQAPRAEQALATVQSIVQAMGPVKELADRAAPIG